MNQKVTPSGRLLRGLVVAGLMLVVSLVVPNAHAVSRTYTADADFDEGILINVNHDFPDNDQLQLNTTTTPFPFIWVATSGRGTAVRIDVNTGEVLGEYRTAPQGMGLNPSRTTVDLFGNVWVGNRDETSGGQGSAVKIGLVIGGTRGDKNFDGTFTPNPAGSYLSPPFVYNTCVDRDGDGLIKTSLGLSDVLSWHDVTDGAGGVDGLVEDAEDECILIYQRTAGPNTRHLSVDANNDVWISGYNFAATSFDLLDGDDGSILTTFGPSCGGYGGLIDGNGVLWSAAISQGRLYRYDTNTLSETCIPINLSYGLGIDSNGNVWNSMWTTGLVTKLAPDGSVLGTFPVGGTGCRGVAVTPVDDDVWIACSNSNLVSRLDNAGNILETIGVGVTPTGVAVDANGKVWVTNRDSDSVMRIDPTAGVNGLGGIDLTVPLGAGAGPYNYSDMTGIVVTGSTAPQGTWNVVFDGAVPGIGWGQVLWNGLEPAGTGITVRVRASDSEAALPGEPFLDVLNGVDFDLSGQYIEIQTVLARDIGVSASPLLYDLTVQSCTTFEVVFGDSWDGTALQEVFDTEYGPGVIVAETDYEGFRCGDADPPYWEDLGLDGLIIREIAGNRSRNTFGWYAETLQGPPVLDDVGDGVIFTGPMGEGETQVITFPGGVTRFGFYMNPNGALSGVNAPEPETFFTNRSYNDIGPRGLEAIHAPDGGDPQCLVYNISDLRGVPTFVLAWEDLDSGAEITAEVTNYGTDNDFQDLVVEISALSPVPAVVTDFAGVDRIDGIQVEWSIDRVSTVDALEIWRSSVGETTHVVASWLDDGPTRGQWIDHDVVTGRTYRYELVAVMAGYRATSDEVVVVRQGQIPVQDRLVSCVPNPFNPKARLYYSLTSESVVSITIYDVAGRQVRSIQLGNQPAGESFFEWSGQDDRGRPVASGTYLVRMGTAREWDQLRITLLK